MMRFGSGVSDEINVRNAAVEASRLAGEQLRGAPCDLVCLFASTIYRADWVEVLGWVRETLKPKVLIGASGSGIIGGEKELEWVPAVSVIAACLPEVKLSPFVVTPDELELSHPGGFWVDKVGLAPDANPVFVLCADPYTCEPGKLVTELSQTYRSRPIVGGLVSGGNAPGEQLLFMGGEVYHEGAVGVAMAGNIEMDTIVSQGCRPIGRPYLVTRAEDHLILELGGREALVVLHEVLSGLSPEDRELIQESAVFLGLVIDEMQRSFSSGDFLIRNIAGIDPDAGAISVTDRVRIGQTIQFHVLDASASRIELRRLLARMSRIREGVRPAGCLFFNCLGRGKSLYGTAHHDIRTIQTMNGRMPIGGIFCHGEIGPLRGVNLLHGYTASLGMFRPVRGVAPHGLPAPGPNQTT